MITYPQSIKKLGQFLTADNISAGTPNGGKDISGATEYPALRKFLTAVSGATETPNGGKDISGATDGSGALGLCIYYVAKLYFLFGGGCIGLSSVGRPTPLGVPTDLQS